MSLPGEPRVMLLDADAPAYAEHIQRLGGPAIPLTVCQTAAEARSCYAGQTILLGAPGLIASVLDEMPGITWVQSTWAGVRPLLEGARSDYVLTGVKGVFGPPMTEYVIGYLLAHEMKILRRAEHQQRHDWFDAASGTLRGKRAGIMGTGSIGGHIAGTLKHLGVETRGFSRSGTQAPEFAQVFRPEQLPSFLDGLDYLVAALPDTPATDGLLDARALSALPRHAVLINIGRGSLIDELALIAALEQGHLAGAVLDVFSEEPLPPGNPLWEAPNVTVTAHVAARSFPADITPIFIENYRRYSNGQSLQYIIDTTRGY